MFTCNDMNPKISKMEKVKTWKRAFFKFFFSRKIIKQQQKTFEKYFDKENYLMWKSVIFVLRIAKYFPLKRIQILQKQGAINQDNNIQKK